MLNEGHFEFLLS